MIRVLKKLLDHDSPGVPEPSSNDDHDGACPDAYLMRTPFKAWCFFRGLQWGRVSAGDDLPFPGNLLVAFLGACLPLCRNWSLFGEGGWCFWKCWRLTDPHIFDGFGLTMFHVVSPVDSVKVVTKSFTKCRS